MTGLFPHKITVSGGLGGDDGGSGGQARSKDKFCSCMLAKLETQFILLKIGF